MYCVQLLNKPTSFKSISVKPYFWPKNTYDVEPDEPEAPVELDEPKVPAELDKLEAHLPTLEVPQKPTEPAKPAVKRG